MSLVTALLLCLLALQLKHFLADFCFQTPYMLQNKGAYGHPGGLSHAGLHGLMSLPVLVVFSPLGLGAALVAVVLEALVHYHVDYIKDRLGRKIAPQTDDKIYWILLGGDQLAHQVTLMALTWWAFSA